MKQFALLVLFLALTTRTQAQSTTTSAPSQQGPFKFTITKTQGIVRVRESEDAPWQTVKVGMELTEGAEFETGPKSSVVFVIPPDETVALDRLGRLKLLRSNIVDGKVVTDLGMKYGRTRYEIEAAEREHDTHVRSPAATLAVRGTQVDLYDQPPFAPQATSFTGRATFRDAHKEVAFGNKGAGKTTVSTDKDSSAQLALTDSYVDPSISFARTPAEQKLIEQTVGKGGILSFDMTSNIPVIRGGVPLTTQEILASPPGALDFILTWTGNTDLNLIVSPISLNETIAPIFPLNHSTSGGQTAFDHRGGPNGGFEIVFWPANYPGSKPGPSDNLTYVAAVQYVTGEGTPFVLTVLDSQDTGLQPPLTGFAGPQVGKNLKTIVPAPARSTPPPGKKGR
jgi:hypothetical protein